MWFAVEAIVSFPVIKDTKCGRHRQVIFLRGVRLLASACPLYFEAQAVICKKDTFRQLLFYIGMFAHLV
jgi:hypothetical protein